VAKYSPILADRLAATTDEGIESIGRKIVKVLGSSITESASKQMIIVLELIRKYRLMKAKKYLYDLEKVFNGLSAELQLRVYYNLACVESRIAEKYL